MRPHESCYYLRILRFIKKFMKKDVIKKAEKQEKELFLKCDCGCGQQLLIIKVGDYRCEINTRIGKSSRSLTRSL